MNPNDENRRTSKSGVTAGGPHSPQPSYNGVSQEDINQAMRNTSYRPSDPSFLGSDLDSLPRGKK